MLAENFLQTDASSSCNSWLFHTHNATALFSVEAAGGLATTMATARKAACLLWDNCTWQTWMPLLQLSNGKKNS